MVFPAMTQPSKDTAEKLRRERERGAPSYEASVQGRDTPWRGVYLGVSCAPAEKRHKLSGQCRVAPKCCGVKEFWFSKPQAVTSLRLVL